MRNQHPGGGNTQSKEPSLASITLSPSTSPAGSVVVATATLTGAAPSGGANVTLAPDPVSSATIPASVVVPAGATSAKFNVTLSSSATGSVSVYGNYGPGAGSTHFGAVTVGAVKTAGPTPAPVPTPKPVPPVPAPPVPAPTPTPAPPPPAPGNATFVETFSEGSLNTNVWIASNWLSDNYAGAGSNVTFTPNNISLSQGMLQLTLEQPTAGTSTAAELQSKETFGYGTFEFVMRMSSTSPTAEGSGSVVSGSDSAGFIYINNSQTELDIEFCGNTPGIINCTNWSTLNAHQTTSPSVANLAAGFHTYQLIWTPGQVQWTIDGVVVATHTSDVPSTPAYIMINFWGTNSANWGGLATPGVTRYMYVSSVSFTPYEA